VGLRITVLAAGMLSCFLLLTGHGDAPGDWHTRGELELSGYHSEHLLMYPQGASAHSPAHTVDEYGWARLYVHGGWDSGETFSAALTMRGESRWGSRNISDFMDANIARGWIRASTIAFTPLSLTAGRFQTGTGHDLWFSESDDLWILDGIHGIYDALPWEFRVIGARVSHLSLDSPLRQVYWWQGAYRRGPPWLPSITFYQGIASMERDATPMVSGVLVDMYHNPDWHVTCEGAFEFGNRADDAGLLAGLADLQISYTAENHALQPRYTVRWTWASGDAMPGGRHDFIPFMNSDQWGIVFKPRLQNIHMFSINSILTPLAGHQCRIGLYYYIQAHARCAQPSRPSIESSGYSGITDGENHTLGSEADLSWTWLPAENLSLVLDMGCFFAGNAFDHSTENHDAAQIHLRAELSF
jgi:hypothetical protein